MRALHAMMMLLGALAVLMTGAAPASALTDTPSPPPCHETAMHHAGAEMSSPASGKAVKTMDCCVACVTAAALRSPDRPRMTPPQPATSSRPAALPSGERPAPEPHPPRSPFL